MNFEEMLKKIEYKKVVGSANPVIEDIHYDSRKVKKNSLFVCIKGLADDGHSYIDNAIKNGACAVIVSDESSFPKGYQAGVPFVLVRDSRKAMAELSWVLFGRIWEEIDLIGITGTNGKSSTAIILNSILEKKGLKTGLIGTIYYLLNGEKHDAERTTPESPDLARLFKKMKDSGAKVVIMEVTSHALSLDRVHGIKFKRAVFTNLTHDHLDFHGTIENYREAKFKFFEMLKEDSNYNIIANGDDPNTNLIPQTKVQKILTFGLRKNSEIYPSNMKLSTSGTSFDLNILSQKIPIESKLIGKTSVYNILAASGVALSLNIEPEIIQEGVKKVTRIPGRLDPVDLHQNFHVFIDYAHTPDALEKILTGLREICEGRIITLFGCGGDRDKEKRKIMGSISAKYSDLSIITNDNPRSEDPLKIIEGIEEGFEIEGVKDYIVKPDRAEAIRIALDLAKPKDVVLIAGKGHETYQIVGNKILNFDDRKVVLELLKGER